MLTQKDVARLQDKLGALQAPRCSRCNASTFVQRGDKYWCANCGKDYTSNKTLGE